MGSFKLTEKSIAEIKRLSTVTKLRFIDGMTAGKDLLAELATDRDEHTQAVLKSIEPLFLERIAEVTSYLEVTEGWPAGKMEVLVAGEGRSFHKVQMLTAEMVNRIDEAGELRLTMDDISPSASFATATILDVKISNVPCERARTVVLVHKGKVRCLKDCHRPLESGDPVVCSNR